MACGETALPRKGRFKSYHRHYKILHPQRIILCIRKVDLISAFGVFIEARVS